MLSTNQVPQVLIVIKEVEEMIKVAFNTAIEGSCVSECSQRSQ